MTRQLHGDEARLLGVSRQIAQGCLALARTGLGIAAAEQNLGAGLVDLRHEAERAGARAVEASDRPARQDAVERLDVVVRGAATDAEREQLEDLAAEILVEA